MPFRDKKRFFFYCVLSLLLFFAGRPLGAEKTKSHPDVLLKNEQGEQITPSKNKSDAYSPKKTCGACHGYGIITSGYHFQQGFDTVSDRYNLKKPWELSPGMYGKWFPFAATGRLASKVNDDAKQIDLTTYDWIGGGGKLEPKHHIKEPSCGWCHPGGGPLECGRNREGKADLSENLIAAEALNKAPLDGDFSSRFSPDRRSHFKESGVVEADCLLCHLPDYRIDDRNRQISAKNYRWAATAGADLGRIDGEVFQYKNKNARPDHSDYLDGFWNFARRPIVNYYWQDRHKFSGDGKLRGSLISKSVGTNNCRQCHGAGEAKNTGSIYAGQYDVHAKRGLQCTDCHNLVGATSRERLRHQIAKGHSLQLSNRDDLDGVGMKTCVGCHYENQYRRMRKDMPAEAGNPQTVHQEKFPKSSFHFYIVQCNACHITSQPAKGLYLLDMSTGMETGFTADNLEVVVRPEDYGRQAKTPWKPWMTRSRQNATDDEHYLACVPKLAQWFGEKMKNGEIRPIGLHYVRKAGMSVGAVTIANVTGTDGSNLKLRTINTDEDIRKMISKLTAMGFRDVVYVADQIYELSRGRILASLLPPSARTQYYAVVHGVGPADNQSTYGTKGHPDGCISCHAEDAPFFSKKLIKNMRGFIKDYPLLKEPNAQPQMMDWGLDNVPMFE